MNFEFTSEQLAEAARIRRLANEQIGPDAQAQDELDSIGRDEILRRHYGVLAESGYLGLPWHRDAGGRSASVLEWALCAEPLARASASTYLSAAMSAMTACAPIAKFGDDAQIDRWLAPAVRGEKIGAFAMTEPDGGSDFTAIRTRAHRINGGYVLNGRKAYVLNGPLCDFAVVLAATTDEGGPNGASLFAVDSRSSGFRWDNRRETMGHRGAPLSDLVFEDCRVGLDALIGAENQGFGIAMHAAQYGRLAACVGALGIAGECLKEALLFAKGRKSAGKSILKHQEVSFKIAQMQMMLDTSRLLTQYAAWSIDEGNEEAGPDVSAAKVHAGESATKISSMAVQILGGAGYVQGNAVERLYRDARAAEIVHGTTEIHRILLAQDALERYA